MRTCLVVGHTGAAPTVKEGGEKERYDAEVGKVVEDLLRGVRSIVVSYPGMVPADNEMGAAEVLPHDGVEDCFPRAGITHLSVERGQHGALAQIIMLHECVVGAENHLVLEIASLLAADDGINENTVHEGQC